MHNGFTKGLIVGGLIGASVSMMMDPGIMNNKSKRKMMRAGRSMLRRSGGFIGDMVDMLR
jgi:gas vesicle protein